MVPPAPGLLSTITDWPSSACSGAPTRRATMSDEPPGEKVTMTRTGLVGQVWADAFPTKNTQASKMNIISAPSVGCIAPRRAQQRHMVMAAAIADVEAHRHDVEKLLGLEVLADVELEPVLAGPQRAFGKRLVGTAVLVGGDALQALPRRTLIDRELDLHAGARTSVRRIQHVSRDLAHQPSASSFSSRPLVMCPICSRARPSSVCALFPRRRAISSITLARFACRRSATMQGKPNFSR